MSTPEALLRELGIRDPVDIDIEAIAQHCGVTVYEEPLAGCAARIIGVGEKAIVVVNSNDSLPRRRFSIAHELGHWAYDRGAAAFECSPRQFLDEWGQITPEYRANRYAAELLLPKSIFGPRCRRSPASFATVDALSSEFQTSRTATAIRLVELGSAPSMLVCSSSKGRHWFVRGPDVPTRFFPTDRPGSDTLVADAIRGHVPRTPETISSAAWFDCARGHRHWLTEDVRQIGEDRFLSLISWTGEDERQLMDDDDPD